MPKKSSWLSHLLNLVLRPIVGHTPPSSNHLPQQPPTDDRETWSVYWKERDQPWRTEPEIDINRQKELAERRKIVPDIQQGIYPFKGMKLRRADVEWLLATHENGRGPVDWSDESQRSREGLDLRGVDLRGAFLLGLPLARLCCGSLKPFLDAFFENDERTEEEKDMANVLMDEVILLGAHLEGANLSRVHLEKTSFGGATLERIDLREAHLEGRLLANCNLRNAILRGSYLRNCNLFLSDLEGADLFRANLREANLSSANLKRALLTEAYLGRADLSGACLEGAGLSRANLCDEKRVGPQLVDVQWGNTNLAVLDWLQMKMLGDEYKARQRKTNGKVKHRGTRITEYERAVRANRQLAMALQSQGLNEDAARFAYRAQALQKKVLWYQMTLRKVKVRQRMQALAAWLFSWFLYLLAGYGYRLGRSFLAYLFVIGLFMTLYHVLDPHLAWNEAFVVSMTAFHGRGFSPSTFTPGDAVSFFSALEAFIGLIIEVTFIATLTQRFFNR